MEAASALTARGGKGHRAKGTTKVVARRVMHDRSINVRILARDVYHKRIWLERLFDCAAPRVALTISRHENSLGRNRIVPMWSRNGSERTKDTEVINEYNNA